MVARTCSKCGSLLAAHEAFCPNCGTRYSEQPTIASTQPTSPSSPILSGPAASLSEGTVAGAPYSGTPAGPLVSGASQPEGTVLATPYSSPPATVYGAQSYAPPPYAQSQYAPPPQPYAGQAYVPPPLYTPPPPKQPQRLNILLIAIIGVLLLVLIGGGLFVFLRSKDTSVTPTPTATTQTQAHPTPTFTPTPTIDVTATANAAATVTAVANQNPYPPNTGTLVLNDPMQDNSRGYQWDHNSDNTGSCTFTGGVYHIRAPSKGYICVPEAASLVFTDLAFEANLVLVQGDEEAITFRLDQNSVTYYAFFLYPGGKYSIDAAVNNALSKTLTGSSPAIKDLKQGNLLAIVARGNVFSLYVNHQLVRTVNDSSIVRGQIGLLCYNTNGSCDVAASNVRVWQL